MGTLFGTLVRALMGAFVGTTTGADASGHSTGKKPLLVIIFLENTREHLSPEIITSTCAGFW